MVKYTLTEALKIMKDIRKQHPIIVAVYTNDGTILEDAVGISINGDAIQVGVDLPHYYEELFEE